MGSKEIMINRLLFLVLGCLLLPASPTLCGPIAEGSPKFLGNIIASRAAVPSNFKDYWNQVTPENAGKWASVESRRGVMNWTQLDVAYHYAKDNNLPFKEHTFVWGNQEPDWIDSLTPEEQRIEVEEWIKAFAERYPETDMIDVVNEPLSRPASYREALGGSGASGWDWVVWAFEKARQYCPKAKLFINEYNVENFEERTDQYVQIISVLNARDLIDGIGIQSHYFSIQGGTSADTIRKNLDKLAATGLPLYSTELDITGNDSIQLADYERLFPLFWKHPAVVGVTLWGWLQGNTWEDSTFLIRSSGVERPALKWLRDYVARSGIALPPPVPAIKPEAPFSLKHTARAGVVLCIRLPMILGWHMTDIRGRTVVTQPDRFFSSGEYALPLRVPRLPEGVFNLVVKGGGAVTSATIFNGASVFR